MSLAIVALAFVAPRVPASPQSSGEVVTVYYDKSAVPHIVAGSDEGVFWGLGRQQMRDFPMYTLSNLWLGTGASASVWGSTVGDPATLTGYTAAVANDITAIKLRWPRIALQLDGQLDPTVKSLLDAYVAGVNEGREDWLANQAGLIAFESVPGVLSAGFYDQMGVLQDILNTPITRIHVLCFGLRLAYGLSGGSTPAGSNAWIIGRSASKNGHPMLMGDPHVGLDDGVFRSYFVQMHAQNGTYRVTGATFAGWPCIAFGFNERVAWGLTAAVSVVPANSWHANTDATGDAIPIAGDPAGPRTQAIQRQSITLPYKILGQSAYGSVTFDARWVKPDVADPVYPSWYPVVSEAEPHVGVHAITFGQGSVVAFRSMWEGLILLGKVAHLRNDPAPTPDFAYSADVLANRDVFLENILLTSVDGDMQYVRLGRIAKQGADAALSGYWDSPTYDPKTFTLNGNAFGDRWQGFHTWGDWPKEFAAGSSQTPPANPDVVPPGTQSLEVWINDNVSPRYVRPVPTIDFDYYATNHYGYLGANATLRHWRQFRAEELLRMNVGLPGVPGHFLTPANNQDASFDRQDWRTKPLRKYFFATYAKDPGSFSTAVANLVEFLNLADDADPAKWQCIADRHSEEQVYMDLLLRSYFTALPPDHVADTQFASSANDEDFVPLHNFTMDSKYHVIRTAMAQALSTVGDTYFPNGGAAKLYNTYLTVPPLVDTGDPVPYGPSGSSKIVWGQCHSLVATPGFAGLVSDASTVLTSSLVPTFPFQNLTSSFAVPTGGIAGALDAAVAGSFFGPVGMPPAGLPPSNGLPVLWSPQMSGSQVMLTVELPPPPATPKGFFLQALGSSEFAQDHTGDSLIDPTVDRRYATAKDYANGTWREILTNPTDLAALPPPTFGTVVWTVP
ncbi:MAG TPA: penicillin acylase family protein [Planctomycetota bacterium]|nr:penicillin acylase family protein [Planctomycetota bacterium]